MAAVVHTVLWEDPPNRTTDYAKDRWELYNIHEDFGLATYLADKDLERLAFMKSLFIEEVRKNNVFPMDDRAAQRLSPAVAGRPRHHVRPH